MQKNTWQPVLSRKKNKRKQRIRALSSLWILISVPRWWKQQGQGLSLLRKMQPPIAKAPETMSDLIVRLLSNQWFLWLVTHWQYHQVNVFIPSVSPGALKEWKSGKNYMKSPAYQLKVSFGLLIYRVWKVYLTTEGLIKGIQIMFIYISFIILINQSTAVHSNILMLYFCIMECKRFLYFSWYNFWPVSAVALFLLSSHSQARGQCNKSSQNRCLGGEQKRPESWME